MFEGAAEEDGDEICYVHKDIPHDTAAPLSHSSSNTKLCLSAFCYSWPTHINGNGMYVCVLGIPKGKFSKKRSKNT